MRIWTRQPPDSVSASAHWEDKIKDVGDLGESHLSDESTSGPGCATCRALDHPGYSISSEPLDASDHRNGPYTSTSPRAPK